MNEIMVKTDRTFQAKELNDAVKGLSRAFQNIDKNRKDACLIMWRLEDGKKYEKDGFKSLFEFAETIGIDKSTAHKMADAGRVYDSKVPEIAQFADKAGYTVAANVASMLKDNEQAKKLEEAIKDNSLNENMTVDKVKTWKADAIAQSKPEKVVPNWEIKINGFSLYRPVNGDNTSDVIEATAYNEVITTALIDPVDYAREYDESAIVSKAKLPDGSAIYLALCSDGSMFNYTAKKVKKEAKPAKKAKKSLDDMTPEELQAWAKSKGLNITFTNVSEG